MGGMHLFVICCAPTERGTCARTACLELLRLPACRPAQGRDISHFRRPWRPRSAPLATRGRMLWRNLRQLWRFPEL
eukprot:5409823-Pleurochrysis_carterae.AAC.2